MNSTAILDLLHSHRSIRKYKPDLVDDETIRRVVAAGQSAATSSNLQMGTAVVVRNRDRRWELARLCGDQEHIREAPVFIAWCADRSRLDRASLSRGYEQNTEYLESFLVAAVDAAIMMQSAVTAAEALGLGTCYIGAIRNDPVAVIELLELPQRVFPIAGMTLGYPRHPSRVKPRLDLDAVLHWERYDPADHERLEQYDRVIADTGIYRGREQPLRSVAQGNDRNRDADASIATDLYGWIEHSARRIAEPKRTRLSEVIRRQGFDLK